MSGHGVDRGARLTEQELTALEGAVLSRQISVQQVVEAIVTGRCAAAWYEGWDERNRGGTDAVNPYRSPSERTADR